MAHEADVEQRIIDLELRFMRTEKLLEDLNDVVFGQQREMERLQAEVKALRDQVLAGLVEPAKNEPPPHY